LLSGPRHWPPKAIRSSLGPGFSTSPGAFLLQKFRGVMPSNTLSNDYFVRVKCYVRSPSPRWMWEIQRRSKPLGVQLYGEGFSSQSAAKLAGEKELREILDRLEHQVADPAPSVGADSPPVCTRCSTQMKLTRRLAAVGTLPTLFVFRCTTCGNVEKQKG
jgi:hypothetical protein